MLKWMFRSKQKENPFPEGRIEIKYKSPISNRKDFLPIIVKGVRYRARKHFLAGDFRNPYCPSGDPRLIYYLPSPLQAGMAEIYQLEMDELIHQCTCPTCGQFTMGDLDY